MLDQMLSAAGIRVRAGGNLGTPALDLLDADTEVFVLELSSFQLERSAELPLHAAVVLNVSPDHLDHHGGLDAYAAAKQRIYARCGTAIVNRDEPALAAGVPAGIPQTGFTLGIPASMDWGVIENADGQWIARGSCTVMPVRNLRIAGRHNIANALAAFALAETLDAPVDGLVVGAQLFEGLPHRMQIVCSEGGVVWIDDSKATNEGAALASIGSIDGGLILIAGGDAKGGTFEALAAALAERNAAVILLGKDRDFIAARLYGISRMQLVADIEEAVSVAARLGAARRHRAAGAGLQQSRHVHQLRRTRRALRRRGPEYAVMTRKTMQPGLQLDWGLVALICLLLGMGLVMLTSASISVAENNTGKPFYYLVQQLAAVLVGLVAAGLVLRTPTDFWQRSGPVLLIGAIILLAAVLVPGVGREVNGSTRWLGLGPINIQVSEPARLMVLMYIAGYAVRHRDDLRASLKDFMRPMLVIAVVCGLLLAEPDFGATFIMLLLSMAVLFVAGAPIRYFVGLCLLVVSALAALAVSAPYRLARITGFTDPWQDPFGSGFQLTQSLIAIGSGELFGVGLGNSVQKLFYLPEAHTDFVFAVIAEEFGLAGTVVLIAVFAALVWRAFVIAADAAERNRYYQAYLAFGIAVWQGAQVFINLGVNMGILPTKGLTLPLISYGRSSLIVTLAALALLLRIDMENRVDTAAERGKKRARKTPAGRAR